MTQSEGFSPEKKYRNDVVFMHRAIQLAYLGNGKVRRNPLVGSVIVAEGRIIGEGYYRREGGPHAEIQALRSIQPSDTKLLPLSTIYVSLEPCCIFGRTPPCSSAIIAAGIPRVVISVLDLTPGVAGRSVTILREAGVEVITGIAAEVGRRLAAFRNVYVSKQRPRVVLKWAETQDGYIGKSDERISISNAYTQRLTHRWRAASTAILIGTNTALTDRPRLDTRRYFGPSPTRIVLDRRLAVPSDAPLLDGSVPTIVVTECVPPADAPNLTYWQMAFDNLLPALLKRLAAVELATLLVEGGARLLQSFIDAELWDEARIFGAPHRLTDGVAAPRIRGKLIGRYPIGSDVLKVYEREPSTG